MQGAQVVARFAERVERVPGGVGAMLALLQEHELGFGAGVERVALLPDLVQLALQEWCADSRATPAH